MAITQTLNYFTVYTLINNTHFRFMVCELFFRFAWSKFIFITYLCPFKAKLHGRKTF
jgi:hypothetical protein